MILWPWLSQAAVTQTFLPSLIQIEGLAAVFASALVMTVLGRAILGSRVVPELALIAGWGATSLALTLWGVTTPESMRIPAAGLIGVAAIAAVLPRGRLSGSDVAALGKLLLIGLPLIAVMAAAYPAGPDSFTNQIPNAAYLSDYGQFPGIGRPAMLALWPAFPYNLQLAAFLPAMLVPAFPPNLLAHVNLLLELSFALLLARFMRGAETVGAKAPSWPAVAGAVLLATYLNPGFEPSLQFSGYADPAVAITVAFAAYQAERLLAALAGSRSIAEERLTLVFVLLAGVAIKQVSVFLMGSVVAVAVLLGAFDKRIGPVRAFVSLTLAFLPALLLVGVWRFYVDTHFAPDDELRFLPFHEWGFASIPAILENMALRVWQRLPFFVLLYGVALSAVPLVVRRGLTPAARLFLMVLGVTLLYTGFLIFTYISHFPGEIGASAHSFFRYNTHLEFLATLAIVADARERWIRRGSPTLGPGWRGIGVAAIVLALAVPVAASGWTRNDRRQPEPLIWNLAAWTAPYLHQGDRVALLLPGDNRSVAFMLRVAIALDAPHRNLADFDDMPTADAAALSAAHGKPVDFALISCVPTDLAQSETGKSLKLTAGEAALLARKDAGWALVSTHAYPDIPAPEHWTTELSPGPFCR
jgi:hypothetical protein